ncbi:MAG: alpha/beta hydrolase [Devosia sp.]|uniref:alpha/beta fold hydrolase n=1 Tax=Devosia sp. TaxID=1871048 RepID=UPI0024CA8001|nr:alpha/beta hydrolase [Devosia sp.]UYO00373.1 MAG: alpha/beta hydrolase [Devosia sp.]
MTHTDDDLTHLAEHGMPDLPSPDQSGMVENEGAKIWYWTRGTGSPVILLHGGLGHAGNWAYQVEDLIGAGYQVVAIDSRGQGHSSRTDDPYTYDQMGRDTLAVMDKLGIGQAAIVGWSDGADTGLVMARQHPERIKGLYFFACNVDATGALPFQPTPVIDRIYAHHVGEYAKLSPTPEAFERMRDDLGVMQSSQPNYTAADLADIGVPVWSVIGTGDEFIRRDHAEYIAASLPNGSFHLLPDVSHFAPLQRPGVFNASVSAFLAAVWN